MAIGDIGSELSLAYNSINSLFPPFAQEFISLFLIVVLIFGYSVFVWKLYRILARKNVINLDLKQYNNSEYALGAKVLAVLFYIAEYIIIMPLVIFIGFSIFTLFLIFLTENLEIKSLLIISAAIIAAIRMAAYYQEDLSKDIAKLLPFTLLAVSILNPNFFSIERIFNQFQSIPGFFSEIFIYLAFIITLEIILRIIDSIFGRLGLKEKEIEEETDQN
jgi:hypothetical protein